MTTDINWDAVERDYRAGQMSNRELARVHGVSEAAVRKRAKRDGWEKDLSVLVEQSADAKLLRREAALVLGAKMAEQAGEKQLIEAVAERRADLIDSHRRDAHAARALVRSLLVELGTMTTEAQKKRAAAVKAEDAEESEKQKASVLKNLGDRATIAQKLSASIATLVSVERESILGKKPEEDNPEKASPFRMFFGGKPQKDRADAVAPKPDEAPRTTH